MVVGMPGHRPARGEAVPAARRLALPVPAGYGLAYASQREDWIARAHRRAARLHQRLGSPHRQAFGGTPAKPKWMRWPTYERLAAELQEIDAGLEEAMERAAARILA